MAKAGCTAQFWINQSENNLRGVLVGKEKKTVNAELINNTIAYSFLSIWAVIGSLFLFYFTIVFAGIFLGDEFPSFVNPLFFLALAFLLISFSTCYVGLKHAFNLYVQWRRKWAMDAEDKRILRLLDESTDSGMLLIEEEAKLEQFES
jgi:pilus assembly protein TadC